MKIELNIKVTERVLDKDFILKFDDEVVVLEEVVNNKKGVLQNKYESFFDKNMNFYDDIYTKLINFIYYLDFMMESEKYI